MAKFLGTSIHVMIVDDHAHLRSALRMLLEQDGMTACEAADSSEMLASLSLEEPHVVLLDVMLGTAESLPLIPEIRNLAPQARILAMSGYAKLMSRALEAGADGFMAKGGKPKEIPLTIRGLLA